RAELAWDDTCTALGIVVRSPSPVLVLCRKLIEAGHNPSTPLEAYRGSTLALRVKSIGQAAQMEVNGILGSYLLGQASGEQPPLRVLSARRQNSPCNRHARDGVRAANQFRRSGAPGGNRGS